MNSEIVISRNAYNPTGTFKYWCQHVLPLVYDDSLSYYELLCKVVDYLNNVIENVDNLKGDIDNTIEAFNQLQEYVNNYFNSIDIQEEINNKLDTMAKDGSLTSVIAPTISSWLAKNITPTSPAIDASFSVSGAGADSATVGRKALWYRGRIFNDTMSEKIDNGWWQIEPNYTQPDAPVPITQRATLEVYNDTFHSMQIINMLDGKRYIRDINHNVDPIVVGDWKEVDTNHLQYRGRITSGLLSDYTTTGWYFYTSGMRFDDEPFKPTNYTILTNYYTAHGIKQIVADVYNRMVAYRWISGGTIGPWRTPEDMFDTWANNNVVFVAEMNKWAKRLELTNTVYANPSGTNPNNKITPFDLCKVASFAGNISVLSDISSRQSAVIFNGDEEVTVTNSTPFSYFSDKYDILFTKTGQLTGDNAINNLVTIVREKNTGICLVGAVMNCTSANARFTAMRKVLDRAFEFATTGTGTTVITGCEAYSAGLFVHGSSDYHQIIGLNETVQYTAASTAKVITAIIGALYCNLGTKFLVRDSAQTGGSGNNLTTGNKVTVFDLLVDMLLPSSNTAAAVLDDGVADLIVKGRI